MKNLKQFYLSGLIAAIGAALVIYAIVGPVQMPTLAKLIDYNSFWGAIGVFLVVIAIALFLLKIAALEESSEKKRLNERIEELKEESNRHNRRADANAANANAYQQLASSQGAVLKRLGHAPITLSWDQGNHKFNEVEIGSFGAGASGKSHALAATDRPQGDEG